MDKTYNPEDIKRIRAEAVKTSLKLVDKRAEMIQKQLDGINTKSQSIKSVQIGTGLLGDGGYIGRFVALNQCELIMAVVTVDSTSATKPQLRVIMKSSSETKIQDWDLPTSGVVSSPVQVKLEENTVLDFYIIDGDNRNVPPKAVGVVVGLKYI